MSEQFRDQPDDFLRRADWTFPIPIAYGPGRFGELPAHCELLNLTNPLIVTDRGTSELSFISEAIKLLESLSLEISLQRLEEFHKLKLLSTSMLMESLAYLLKIK